VIGNSGALTGFAGGLDAKQLLLTLEGYQPALRPKRVVKTAVAQGSLF
jgi:methylated-DNA-[protein]-cysteine S-methyltransferase